MKRHYDIMFAAVSCLALSVHAFEKPVLFNGGFETVDQSGHVSDWNYPLDMFTVDPSGGMNGTKALKFCGSSGGYLSSIQQRVRVYPGVKYNFGCMIRTEKLEGNGMGARICVQFEDPYGRFIDGCYQSARMSGDTNWSKSCARTQETPANAVWATVRVEVVGPKTGSAWFDDVYFTCDVTHAVDCLFSDCYRDEAVDGEVVFAAGINSIALDQKRKPYSCLFTYTDASGVVKTVKPDERTGRKAALKLRVKELAMGESEIAFAITDRDGRDVGRRTLVFNRLAKKTGRKVMFDRRGRCLVDGKPFFPLGMYWSVAKSYHKFKLPVIDEEGVKVFADSPFNCTMAYQPPTIEQLDILQRHGIRSIYCIAGQFGGDWDRSGRNPAKRHAPDAVRKIAQVKDHPAVLAWYLQDERPITMLDDLVGRWRTTKELDPDHPTWIAVYQYSDSREYYLTTDVMGTDPYPVAGLPLSIAYKWASTVRDSSFGMKPFWQVPQAFDWSTFRSGHESRDRMPTGAEMTNMSWQNIAGGANGLVYYSFTYLYQCKSTTFEKAWADTKAAAQTVKDNFDILLSGDEPPAFEVKDAVARTWREGKRIYAVIVNPEEKPVSASLRIAGTPKFVGMRFGSAPAVAENGSMRFELPAIGQSLVEFTAE